MIEKIKSYAIAFLSGIVTVLAPLVVWLIKNVKPTINTKSYVEKLENSIKKLKVDGNSNDVDTSLTTGIEFIETEQPKKRKKFLGIFNRRKLDRWLSRAAVPPRSAHQIFLFSRLQRKKRRPVVRKHAVCRTTAMATTKPTAATILPATSAAATTTE